MSSLAATQADGYYIPPDYHNSGAYKKKSVSQFNNKSKGLRAKGHNQYLQRSVCRFELPFDGFCTKCDAIVGKGTRFNAHKAHVDDYFTTKIYEFTTNCRACGDCEFKIRTNPKEQTFDYVSGMRKKVEEFDTKEAGTHGVIDTEFGNGVHQYRDGKLDATDKKASTLNALERSASGYRKSMTETEHMESLMQLNSKMLEDSDANAAIRASFRKDRKAKKHRLGEATRMGLGRGIELSGETESDKVTAKLAIKTAQCKKSDGRAHESEQGRFASLRSGSIFDSKKLSCKGKKRRRHDDKRGKSEKKPPAFESAGTKKKLTL